MLCHMNAGAYIIREIRKYVSNKLWSCVPHMAQVGQEWGAPNKKEATKIARTKCQPSRNGER